MTAPPSQLPDDGEKCRALRDAQLKAGHCRNTRNQYQSWMRRYRQGRAAKTFRNLQGFLDHLATVDQVNPKTIHQALCALKFYHEKVLGIEIPPNSLSIPKINRNRNHPNFLNRQETVALLSRLRGMASLQARFLIGTGSRITAMLSLRLKDIDLERGTVCFRFDKGGKSRTIALPKSLIPDLRHHVEGVKRQWEADHSSGVVAPVDDPSLRRKLGERTLSSLAWYWVFPSSVLRGNERWHSTDRALQKALKQAVHDARITKRVSAHTLRHTNATFLLERGENIRRIQEHLGHTHLETTEIYLHSTAAESLTSPLDDLPEIIPFPDSSDIRRQQHA